MPIQVALAEGDVPYPQYSVTDREFIKNAQAILKGTIYTVDAAGRLVDVSGSGDIADLNRGAFQATVAADAPTAEDTDEVQVLKQRSRIILKAPVNLSPGDAVELECNSGTVDPDKVAISADPRSLGYLGRIFEILTLGTDGIKKQFTADDDLIVIDLET